MLHRIPHRVLVYIGYMVGYRPNAIVDFVSRDS